MNQKYFGKLNTIVSKKNANMYIIFNYQWEDNKVCLHFKPAPELVLIVNNNKDCRQSLKFI